MMTSYWAVGGSMLTNIVDMFKFKSENHVPTRLISLACVVLPPFILAYSGLVSFVDAIYLAGTFGGVIMSILPALMVNSARKTATWSRPGSAAWYSARWVQVLIITLFCAAASMRFWIWWGSCPQAGKRGRKMQCVSFPKTK